MTFYLDTNAVIPLHVDEKMSATLAAWFSDTDGGKIVSDFTAAEFCSAVSKHVRMDILSETQATEAIDSFERWKKKAVVTINITSQDIREAGFLVRRPKPKLLTPDAIHLAVCKRLGLTLVTLDEDLIVNAQDHGVKVTKPA